jgi:hypothetical protein
MLGGLSRNFSPDYFLARSRFRGAAEQAGFELGSVPIDARGPGGETLDMDIARKGSLTPKKALVISSGTHGIEGFFGSAVQLSALSRALKNVALPSHAAVVLIHAINPYGFAHKRRVNESNIDLNRNFLRAGKVYGGAPEAYRQLNGLLNPESPPSLLEPFWAMAGVELAKHGFAALKNAIAQGQYEFPAGLFFGGQAESQSQQILRACAPSWLGSPERVLHIDLHTGLGPFGTYKLGLDMPITDPRIAALKREFGEEEVTGYDPAGVLYEIQGGLGPWLEEQFPRTQYDCMLAEFGTYPSPIVLAAMRKENRAHHYAGSDLPTLAAAKRELLEMFAPRARAWRHLVLRRALGVVDRALETVR